MRMIRQDLWQRINLERVAPHFHHILRGKSQGVIAYPTTPGTLQGLVEIGVFTPDSTAVVAWVMYQLCKLTVIRHTLSCTYSICFTLDLRTHLRFHRAEEAFLAIIRPKKQPTMFAVETVSRHLSISTLR